MSKKEKSFEIPFTGVQKNRLRLHAQYSSAFYHVGDRFVPFLIPHLAPMAGDLLFQTMMGNIILPKIEFPFDFDMWDMQYHIESNSDGFKITEKKYTRERVW